MAPETREIGYSSTVNEQANESENNLNSNVSSSTPSQTNPSVNSQPIATINLNKNTKTTAVDIYAFGIVALEVSLYFYFFYNELILIKFMESFDSFKKAFIRVIRVYGLKLYIFIHMRLIRFTPIIIVIEMK
jgi:hypothetical protein